MQREAELTDVHLDRIDTRGGPEQRAKSEKFFELVRMQKQHEAQITAEVSGWPQGMSLEGVREEDRAALEQSLQRAREILLTEAGWSKVKDDLVEAYAKRFSKEEMDRILQLLDNETGRMLYRKQAELSPEVHAIGESKVKAALPQAMAILTAPAELGTPKIVVCPSDADKKPALRFPDLQASNVSYLVFSGPKVDESNPGEVLARCPVHGHVLHADGSVQQNKGAAPR